MLALRTVYLILLLIMFSPTGSAHAHEGHDHGEQKAPIATAATPRLEATSGPFELVALLKDGQLVIYLDRFTTNEPIASAQIAVETPKGPQNAEAKDGVYRLAAPWADAGSLDLIFTVTEGDVTEILSGTLDLKAARPRDAGPSGWSIFSPALAQGLRDAITNTSPLIALAAFAAGFVAAGLLGLRGRRVLLLVLIPALLLAPETARAHEGHDHGEQKAVSVTGDTAQRLSDGSLFVPKPIQRILAIRTLVSATSTHRKTLALPGRIIPDPNASGFVQASVSGRLSAPAGGFPKLGTAVQAGDVLAFVTPPFQAIDVSDMRQKAGELDQQIDIVAKRVARYESLVKSGTVSRVNYDEALLELKGLRERRAALDHARAESEKLVAPVSGIIASANAVAGQIAETNAVVFQIVDPAKLWVEALTFTLLPDSPVATASTGEGVTLRLSFQGAGFTDRSQAIPVHFSVQGATKGLRVGQLVTVMAATGEEVQGIVVPRAAILRSANGQTILFEHTTAERFEPRVVRVEPLDADNVLVLDGLAAGKRVVVQGAELLNQIR
ncbi:MAG: efflux RND transporter periplasmic adaptor subunit [Hyphomicrobiaceae bacterium]